MLGFSRAVGETMIVVIAAGLDPRGVQPRRGDGDDDGVHRRHRQGDIATGSIAYKTIFAVGTTLFVMTLIMNMI